MGPTTAHFGGTQFSRGFDFTFGPGVQPSLCLVYTVPHTQGLPSVGTLTFGTEGDGYLSFNDCLLEDPRLLSGEQGRLWALPIKDRRWKWQFGYIHGSYNVPRPDGSYLREASPQQLASILLAAMGEAGYDVSRLPNLTRPEMQWDGALPAAELDRLCEALGCLVVLNPFSDRVEIWPYGEGATLPSGPTYGSSYAPVIPAQPQGVRVEAGWTLFQATFDTEPVGLDTDNQWKKLVDLSYKPASGWEAAFPLDGYTKDRIPGTYVSGGRTLNKCDLATATVFRCYRINSLLDKSPFNSGAFSPQALDGTDFEPQSLRDLQLFDELADEEIGKDGGLRPLPAVVYARYWRDSKALPDDPFRYPDGFSFDSQHGIISFNEPLFIFSTTTAGQVEAATVRYECGFHAGKNGLFHRYGLESSTGASWTTPPRLVQRPEITARVIYRYNSTNLATTTDNVSDTYSRLAYWGNAALAEYGQQDGGTINYQKLMPISPDGLTLQVSWSGGGNRRATTIVSQAQRHNRFVPPLQEYRDRLAGKRAEQLVQAMTARAALAFIGGGAV